MEIYPRKPKAIQNLTPSTDAEAYLACHRIGLGEITKETACANLGITGKDFSEYLTKFKAYVDDITKQMSRFQGGTKAELVTSITVQDELHTKTDVIDTLIDRWTAKGTFAEFKKSLN